jgi:hypothetical protein
MSQHKPIYYELCKECKAERGDSPLITEVNDARLEALGRIEARHQPLHIAGTFEEVSEPDVQNFIYKIASEYQHRTGKCNPDGSLGEIKITPKAFVDALAYAYLRKGYE